MSLPPVESKSLKTVPLSRTLPIFFSRLFLSPFPLVGVERLPRRSFAPFSLSLPRHLSRPFILFSIPRRSQTLLADETRFVLNFLDRAFRSAVREFARDRAQRPCNCIRLHSSLQPGVDSRRREKSRLILNTSCT